MRSKSGIDFDQRRSEHTSSSAPSQAASVRAGVATQRQIFTDCLRSRRSATANGSKQTRGDKCTVPLVSEERQVSTGDKPLGTYRVSCSKDDGEGEAADSELCWQAVQQPVGPRDPLSPGSAVANAREEPFSERTLCSLVSGVAALAEQDTLGERQLVRLSFQAHILRDTEASVLREGGRLTVRLRTGCPELHKLLRADANVLRKRLAAAIPDCLVQLEVLLESGGERLAYI